MKTDAEFLKEEAESGSCCVTALIKKGDLIVFNAGDCRAVLSISGAAEALTSDHRSSREDERERIENLQRRNKPPPPNKNPSRKNQAFGGRTSVRVVVIGDAGTGKSSLVTSVATENFPESASRVVPPTHLPADYYLDRVPLTIIDTPSNPEDKSKAFSECQNADAIVLTYACDRPSTLDRLSTYWLPELRRLEIKVPVIVVGCKLDLRDEQQMSLEQDMSPIMQQFREIETCVECSSLRQIQVPEVFYYAQKAVLHPTAPLFDKETQSLKPRCISALKRIFILCDTNRDGALSDSELNGFEKDIHSLDGALSDSELNDFQVKCFSAPLQPTEIAGVKKVVQEKMSDGVNENGLTLTGFLFLHELFIEKARGLKRHEVEAFPISSYAPSVEDSVDTEDKICVICISQYEAGSEYSSSAPPAQASSNSLAILQVVKSQSSLRTMKMNNSPPRSGSG
ncbi:uncharacterized protein A4U43_C02F18250 [Asparagus officinalis]|uniref:protein-serine/threonine phosphatase n=1 Tax=Asparagus officinalis TaxID=4686 RepID=A0A5P1FLU9_ASPOF|nr:uncharacterized protein A4U43_C02F18250 [Asparagus officinalis]